MERVEIEKVFQNALMALRQSGIVPIDTGNLAYNAIKGIWVSDKVYKVYIDEKVADYAKYTIEPWKKGKNPNEGWLEKAFKFLANYVSKALGGEISG